MKSQTMDPAKLKVVELRAELSKRGLDSKGNKAVLVERLRQALDEEAGNEQSEEAGSSPESENEREKTPEPPKPTKTPARPVRSTRHQEQSQEPQDVPVPRTPTRGATRASARAVTPEKKPPVKSPVLEKANELPTIVETPTEDASPQKSSPEKAKEVHTSSKKSQRKQEEPASNASEPVVAEKAAEKSHESPVKQEAHMSPAKPVQEPEASSVKPVQAAESPIKSAERVQQSPVKPTQSAQQSLAKPTQVTQQSPAKPAQSAEQSPVKPAPAAQQSPAKSVKLAQAAQQSPVKTAQASQHSPIKPAQATEQSPAKPAQEPHLSPVKLAQEAHASPMKPDLVASPVKPAQEPQASPVEPNEKLQSPMKSSKETQSPAKSLLSDKVPENLTECTKDEEDPGSYAHLITSEEEMKEDNATEPLGEEEMDSSDKYDHEMEFKGDLKEQDEDTKLKEEDIKDEKMVEAKPDRKRKRSPSPEEELAKSSSASRPEEEPELDRDPVVLSWYDSDLNLVIEKEGFFSATPMHSDGFGYVWAGARATYGFQTGKVFYEVKITENCQITLQDEENPHLLRAGWSVIGTSMQLGEEPLSFGFDGTGKKSTNNEFSDYGESFSKDDVVGCYLDMSSDNVEIFYTVNGNNLGLAFKVSKEELGGRALFPHILTKNCTFVCNFGQEEPWSPSTLEGYVYVGKVDLNDRVVGPQRPEKKEDCEILMLCGLPGAGKTYWSVKYAADHPEKMYNILGTNTLIEKMKVMGLPRKTNYQGKWEVLIDKCSRALTKLLDIAVRRRRNYILDQNNVYLTAQKRKMRHFHGFQRKAIVIVPSEEEFQIRSTKPEYIESKCPDNTVQEMKANFTAPTVGDSFDAVEYVELAQEEAKNLIEKYNKEAKEAGFGQQQEKKRSRFEKAEHRDGRSSRDGRDRDNRRSSYQDRNRNAAWRGGGNSGGGWRDRNQRGGHMRYGGPNSWRGRGGPGGLVPSHRGGLDRRGSDRRSSNDRNRSSSRPGGWGQVGYQGSQQAAGSWGGQQGSWSGAQQAGWNQQGGWGGGQQQWGGNWKGYGQGSYGQSGYNQPNYGNGNWNSWNQQYYNQYWGQNQQSGQTTTAAGGQATSTPAITTPSSTNDTNASYSYSDSWQGYSQTYSFPTQSTRDQQRK